MYYFLVWVLMSRGSNACVGYKCCCMNMLEVGITSFEL
uniref:Uncharacterized protein n=1 Tax=Rhizophora mucronata TaxID=61149 RepID=A0A2P2R0U0_RHIMU